MSQEGILDVIAAHPEIPTQFNANTGFAIPALNELNILGGAGIHTSGSGNTITITATGATGIQTLSGNIGTASPDGSGNIQIAGVGNITTFASTSILSVALTGLTNHAVQVGGTSNVLSQIGPSAAGLVLTSNGPAADPTFQSPSASGAIISITGNSGGAEVPLAGNFNILGTGSITVAGSANTETVQLTGLTNHAVLVGAGTATITNVGPTATAGQVLQSAGAAADPVFSTATYPSTTTINQILYSSSANVVAGLATANNGVLTTGTSGIPVITALASNGQIIIGSGSGAPAAATLTAGTGVTITNGANSITIAATGGSFAWVDVTTATQTMAIQTGYVTDHTNVTYTLPATAALGDQIRVVGKLGITTIAQNANQQILMASASSTVGITGSIVGTNVGDCVWLVCVTAGASTVWRGESFVGNWTVS